MTKPPPHPRLHLLAAKEAPVVVILRRGPSKRYHIMRFRTDTDNVEHGSWFAGRLYPGRCDLSHDGSRMVYLAMGGKGETWNAICKPPSLEPVALWFNFGAWFGGGLWHTSNTLALNLNGHSSHPCYEELTPDTVKELVPQDIKYIRHDSERFGEDEGILYPRLKRDGWQRVFPDGYNEQSERSDYLMRNAYWSIQRDHWPEIQLHYRGYKNQVGRIFEFIMPDHPEFFSPKDDWATFDSIGNLIVAREGRIERWAPQDLQRMKPSFYFDINALPVPERGQLGWTCPLNES